MHCHRGATRVVFPRHAVRRAPSPTGTKLTFNHESGPLGDAFPTSAGVTPASWVAFIDRGTRRRASFLGEIIGSLGRTAACRLKSGHRFHHVCRCFGLWREHLLRTAKCPGALPPPQQRMEHRKTSPAKLTSVVAANFTSSVTAPVVRRLFWNRVTTIIPNLGASPMDTSQP
jgi:hypothetical protein